MLLPQITSLFLYPIKSCRAVAVTSAFAGPRGFEIDRILDRGWVLVDAQDQMVSQRRHPSLARIALTLYRDDQGRVSALNVSADAIAPMHIREDAAGDQLVTFTLHGKPVVGHLGSAEINGWFSHFLGEPIRAVRQKEDDLRLCDAAFANIPGFDHVSFADGFPYLIATEGTLRDLNKDLDLPVPMDRFRPNIVIAASAHESEYGWRRLAVGSAELVLVKPCTRCVMTTIDQASGQRTGKEPLATLAKTQFLAQDFARARVQGAIFGENASAAQPGWMHVGDSVTVLETKPPYRFRPRVERGASGNTVPSVT